MWIFWIFIIAPISLIVSLFVIDYYVFFWGNFILNLVGGISMAAFALVSIKKDIAHLKKRSQQKKNLIRSPINKKFRNKRNQENIKSIKVIIFDLISSIIVIWISFIFFKETYFLSFDIPNVINKNYVKATVQIERSIKASSKGDHHTQYIKARDMENDKVIEIAFKHRYERILVYKNYDIWYLPHSHVGYKALIKN